MINQKYRLEKFFQCVIWWMESNHVPVVIDCDGRRTVAYEEFYNGYIHRITECWILDK